MGHLFRCQIAARKLLKIIRWIECAVDQTDNNSYLNKTNKAKRMELSGKLL